MSRPFTDRARRVVVLAQDEARLLNHDYLGTEHLLLGLIREGEGEGVAVRALESLGISLEAVRAQVQEIIGQGQSAPTSQIPFTLRAKKVLELSFREALQLNHDYLGTEHLLLGLIREGEGVAAQVLMQLGADLSRVRQRVIELLSGAAGSVGAGGGACGSPVGDDLVPAARQELQQGKLPEGELHVDVPSAHPVGAETRSPQATWASSWINPPIRSSRATRMLAGGTGRGVAPSGGAWPSKRCGRCWL